jgi:hypothetical protein
MHLEFVFHLSGDKEHLLKERVSGTDIYRETVTPYRRGRPQKPVVYWYHKDDPEEHPTYEEAAKFISLKP